MAQDINTYKVICAGGLDTTDNYLYLSEAKPGAASRLVNFEPSTRGGYRRISGYGAFDSTDTVVGDGTAEGAVLGAFMYRDTSTGAVYCIAFRKDVGAATYSAWTSYGTAGWTKVTFSGSISRTSTNVQKIRSATANFGTVNWIVFTDGVNDALAFDGTTWYELTPSGSGTTGSPGGDQMLSAPRYVTVWQKCFVFGGDATYPGVVAHTAPESPLEGRVAHGAGQLVLGFDLVNFRPFRDDLFLFGYSRISRAILDGTTFVIRAVSDAVGCIAADSLVEISGDLLFLSRDGVRPIAGTARIGDVELQPLSVAISPTVSLLGDEYDLTELDSVVIPSKKQFRYFYNNSSGRGLLGGLRVSEQGLAWEFADLSGISTSCASSAVIQGEEYVLHGDSTGSLWRQESGNAFGADPISWLYSTPFWDMGDPCIRKTPHAVHAFIRAEGSEIPIYLGITLDWGDSALLTPPSFFAETGLSVVYGAEELDYGDAEAIYGANAKPVVKIPIEASFKSVQFSFSNSSSTDASFSIQGFALEYSGNGRP